MSAAEDRLRRWVARSTASPYVDLETGVLRKGVSVDGDVTWVLSQLDALRAALKEARPSVCWSDETRAPQYYPDAVKEITRVQTLCDAALAAHNVPCQEKPSK